MKFAKIFCAAFIAISAFSLVLVPGSYDANYGNALFYSALNNSVITELSNLNN